MVIITLNTYDNKKAIRIIKHRLEGILKEFKKYKECDCQCNNSINKIINMINNSISKLDIKKDTKRINRLCNFINNNIINSTQKIQTGLLLYKNDSVIVNDLYESYKVLLEEILNTFKESVIDEPKKFFYQFN